MPWAFGIVQESSPSIPVVDLTLYPMTGRLYVGSFAVWGGYLMSGTLAQLQALNALPTVIGLALLTSNGGKWKELDSVITAGMRTKANTWLTANGWPTIPAAWTARQIILFAMTRLNAKYDLDSNWVTDGS